MSEVNERPHEWIVSKRLFDDTDQAVREAHGISFAELASDDPREAFKVISAVSRWLDERSVFTEVGKDDQVFASLKDDGPEATAGMARYQKEVSPGPDIDVDAFDVVVSVFRDPTFPEFVQKFLETQSLEKAGKEIPVPVVSFRVEPPSLA
jgi:hypothetical protein